MVLLRPFELTVQKQYKVGRIPGFIHLFVCENNLYATPTPLNIATKNTSVASRAAAYGLPGVEVDGNDVLAVWQAMRQAVERARSGKGPTLIEAKTYRTVGPHEGDPLVGTYRTREELDVWKNRCPIQRFRKWLLAEGFSKETELAEINARVNREIEEAVTFAESSPMPDPGTANDHVLANPILTMVSCGEYVNRSVAAAKEREKQGVSCEVIDLRTIVPLDTQTILASVAKTGRLLVVDEAHPMCGVGAEIAAAVMEEAFDELDAPVGRLHPDPVTEPFSPSLENAIVVTVEKIVAAAKAVVAGQPPVPRRPKGVSAIGGTDAPIARATAPPKAAPAVPATSAAPKKAAAPGLPVMMPKQDLTVTEGTVVRWIKQVGDAVALNEVIVEVETAKAIVPVESPGDGTLLEILANEGVTVQMGQALGTVQPN